MKSGQSTSQFISALVKNLQAVCHGNVDFDQNVKIVGHLFLTVDSATEFNYIVNEKVSKSDESSTTFISKSFYATDPQLKTPKKTLDRPQPTPNVLGKTRVVNLDPSGDGPFSQNKFSSPSIYQQGFRQLPYHSQSKKRPANSRNLSPKIPKLSPSKEPIEIDLDSDLLVTFATPETNVKSLPVLESDIRVPPVNQPSDENVQKYDDYEVFQNVGFDSGEREKDDDNLANQLDPPSKSPPNLSLSGTEISGHVDLSRVKAEVKDNPESGDDFQNNTAFSQDEGDDSSVIKQEHDSEEFFNTLREHTMGLNTNADYDIPHIPGISAGASYLSAPSTSTDFSKNAGVEMPKKARKKQKRVGRKNVKDQTKNILKQLLTDRNDSTCSECNKIFNTKKSLQIHFNSKHRRDQKIYSCQHCNEQFFSRNCFEGHTNKHNGRKLNCDKCSNSFYCPASLHTHLLECSGQTVSKDGRQCHVCGINMSTNESLLDHIKGVHGNEMRYNCDNCKKSFKWRSSRLKHMESCSKQRFQCHVCGINCSTSQGLDDHIKGVHGNEPRYSCDYCNKPFKWRSTRLKHMEACHEKL